MENNATNIPADQNTPIPQPTNVLPPQAGKEIGASGTYFFKGYITAEEYSIDLQGKYALQVYDVMRKSDPVIHAALNVVKQPIIGADWNVDAASDDPLDVEIQQRLERELFHRKLVFKDSLREAATFLDFGFYTAEIIYDNTEDEKGEYIGIAKLSSRKQRSILKWEMDNGDLGITQILPTGGYVDIPRSKLWYVVNDQEGANYQGVSMLRYVYKPWKIKDGLEIMNAVALENMAMGVPYIKKGINGMTVDEPELEKARNVLRQQRANEEAFLEFPASIEIGWMNMESNTTKDVMPTIQYQDRSILLSVFAQFLLLGANDAAGSKAVSQDHSRLFVKSLDAVASLLKESLQRDVVNRWVDLNYSNLPNGYPTLRYAGLSDEDVAEISTAVAALMTAGAMQPSAEIENAMRTLLNLPELSDDDVDNYDDIVAKNKPAPPTPFMPGVSPANPADPNNPTPPTPPKPAPRTGTEDTDDPTLPDDDEEMQAARKQAKDAQRRLLGAIAEG